MQSLSHILLALLLTLSSPAWCACAFATATSGGATGSDACCDACGPTASAGQHDDADHGVGGGLPCRDRTDCCCCDAPPLANPPSANHAVLARMLQRSDLPPMPAVIALVATGLLDAPTCSLGSAARAGPPLLTTASTLLARRCLLLV